jgi:hypothetical protein
LINRESLTKKFGILKFLFSNIHFTPKNKVTVSIFNRVPGRCLGSFFADQKFISTSITINFRLLLSGQFSDKKIKKIIQIKIQQKWAFWQKTGTTQVCTGHWLNSKPLDYIFRNSMTFHALPKNQLGLMAKLQFPFEDYKVLFLFPRKTQN